MWSQLSLPLFFSPPPVSTCAHTRAWVCVFVYMCKYVYVCAYVCMRGVFSKECGCMYVCGVFSHVCACVCVHVRGVCFHECVDTFMCVHVCGVCSHECTNVCVHVCTRVCICTHVYLCACICVHVCGICPHECVGIHTCVSLCKVYIDHESAVLLHHSPSYSVHTESLTEPGPGCQAISLSKPLVSTPHSTTVLGF